MPAVGGDLLVGAGCPVQVGQPLVCPQAVQLHVRQRAAQGDTQHGGVGTDLAQRGDGLGTWPVPTITEDPFLRRDDYPRDRHCLLSAEIRFVRHRPDFTRRAGGFRARL